MEVVKQLSRAIGRIRGCAVSKPAAATALKPAAAMATKLGEGQRFAFVDALRGIAAMAVALHHICHYGPVARGGDDRALADRRIRRFTASSACRCFS